jgi:FkbM family methyltransferase
MNLMLKLASFTARILPQPVKQVIYRCKPLARLLRRRLNQSAPHGLTRVNIAAGGLRGMQFVLDLQTEKDYWLGTYEPDLQRTARDFIRQGMTIYDVGANIGYLSLLFARLAGEAGQVFAFEALPENVKRLQENIGLNKMESHISVVPAAVVGTSRRVEFLIHASGAMGKALGSAGREEGYNKKIEVEGITLDDFVFVQKHPKPDVIKMDIEGGEVLAVQGMQRLMRETMPILLMETHGKTSAHAVWQALSDNGYHIARMKRPYRLLQSYQQLDWKAYLVAFKPETGSPGLPR